MRVTAPISDLREVEPLAKSGADELYCGYIPKEWSDRYGTFVPFSRHAISLGNFSDLDRLAGAVEKGHEFGLPVFFTLNENYTSEEFPYIERALDRLAPMGFDAFIIGDLALMLYFRERWPEIGLHVSSMSPNFNRQSSAFFRDLGATRIILPRDLKMAEMARAVSDAPDVEFEAFAFYDRCFFVDGFCGFNHGFKELEGSAPQKLALAAMKRPSFQKLMQIAPTAVLDRAKTKFKKEEFACCMTYEYKSVGNGADGVMKHGGFEDRDPLAAYTENFDGAMCGMCEIRRMSSMGIHSLKVVGRAKPTHEKTRAVRMLREAIALAASDAGKDEYVDGCKAAYASGFGRACTQANCYYND